jgi:phosphodiester glycosidase
MTRKLRGLSFAIVAVASLTFSGSAEGSTSTTWTYPQGSGIRLTRVRYPLTPNEVRVISVMPSDGSSIDLATAGSQFPMAGKTSAMAATATGAVLATNGDFGRNGAPRHPTMIDGELWTSGIARGDAFAISSDGQSAFVGSPSLHMKLTRVNGKVISRLASWNAGVPRLGQMNGYTPRGGLVSPVPGATLPGSTDPVYCEARLVPAVGYGYTWSGADRAWITRRYRIARQPEPCTGNRLSLGIHPGAVVLAANEGTSSANKILRLTRGNYVRLWWSFEGWPGVTDVVGGTPQLVDNGVRVAPHYSVGAPHILDYNPRTAIGVMASCSDRDPLTLCRIYLVTVDGRQTDWSKGARLPALARRFLRFGVWDAINLDGGGSTTVWAKDTSRAPCESYPLVGGCLANRPSQTSGERGSVVDAVTVLDTVDPGTPRGLR